MALSAEVVRKLSEPLDPARVSKREGGGGMKLSYLEGWDAIQKANEIFGYGNWGYEVVELVCLGEEPTARNNREGFRVGYRATVKVSVSTDEEWEQTFSDTGFGDSVDYSGSKIAPHELASKEAVTDALKRALKNFGDQFGLCLYDKTAPEHDGIKRDPLKDLKDQVIAIASSNGVEMTPAAIADFFEISVEDLKDEAVLTRLINESLVLA